MLRKLPGSKNLYYQTKINGKTWTRTTGESDRRKAEKKALRLERIANALRNNPDACTTLRPAIKKEVDRVADEISYSQSIRVDYALRNFLDFAGDIKLERIDTQALEGYQKKRLKEAALSTVNCEPSYILRLLRMNDLMVLKPTPKRGKITYQRAFTMDEIKCFFQACPGRKKTLFYTMLVTGARLAELVPSERSSHKALLKPEVDLDKQLVRIRTAKQRKGMVNSIPKIRHIALPDWIIAPLRNQIQETEGEFVFEAEFNFPRDFDLILKKAGIPKFDQLGQKVTAHSFRHTYGTLLASVVGNDPFVLKEALGHTRISTTERYIHNVAPLIKIDMPNLTKSQEAGGV